MAFPLPFRYSLKADAATWYYIDAAGVIQTSTTPAYLQFFPEKWQDTTDEWKRSAELYGQIRAFATQYIFQEDGATILRTLFYSGSIETPCLFTVERYNYALNAYEVFFNGEVDLSTFLDGAAYNGKVIGVSAAIIEGGLDAKLTAAENVAYEIELSSFTGAQDVNFDGIYVRSDLSFAIPKDTTGFALQALVSLQYIALEGYTGGTYRDIPIGASILSASLNADYFYEATVNQSLEIKISNLHLNYHAPSGISGNSRITIYIVYGQSGSSTTQILHSGPAVAPGNSLPYYVNVDVTIPLNGPVGSGVGDRLAMYYVLETTAGTPIPTSIHALTILDDNGVLDLITTQLTPPSLAASLRYSEVVSRLLDKISGTTGTLQSNFFTDPNTYWHDSNPYNWRLICGDALRRLTTDATGQTKYPSIKITWGDLRKDMINRGGVGIAIVNGKVIIERLEKFFNQNNLLGDLGEVSKMSIEPARDLMANSAKWGYPTQSYDKVNGKDEYNLTSVFKYPFATRKLSDSDNLCVIRADMYGIEDVRTNRAGKATTDASTDNDTFMVEVGSFNTTTSAWQLYRPQLSYSQPGQTGLLFFTTAYNLTLTPARNLRRFGAWLHGIFNHLDSTSITYQTSDKNSALAINCGSGTIVEAADIPVNSLDAPFTKPYFFNIEVISPITMPAIMNAGGFGYFTFTENGVQYKGYPYVVGVAGEVESGYECRLLCTADTDLSGRVF